MSNNGRACVSEKYPLIAGQRLDLEREGGARTSAVFFFLEYDLNAAKCNSICHFLGVGTKPLLYFSLYFAIRLKYFNKREPS